MQANDKTLLPTSGWYMVDYFSQDSHFSQHNGTEHKLYISFWQICSTCYQHNENHKNGFSGEVGYDTKLFGTWIITWALDFFNILSAVGVVFFSNITETYEQVFMKLLI